MSKVKAFAYIKAPARGNTCLEKQKEAINRYAHTENIEIVRFYQDDDVPCGISEKSALTELLLNLEGNDQGITAVLVEKLDQLARDLSVQAAIVYQLKSEGVRVISAVEGSLWDEQTNPLS